MLKETAAPLNGFFILISERMKVKTEHRYPPNPQYFNKTKIITFYIYHHIDTQPTEPHFADGPLPARLAITTHRTDMNNLFVTFFYLVNSLI